MHILHVAPQFTPPSISGFPLGNATDLATMTAELPQNLARLGAQVTVVSTLPKDGAVPTGLARRVSPLQFTLSGRPHEIPLCDGQLGNGPVRLLALSLPTPPVIRLDETLDADKADVARALDWSVLFIRATLELFKSVEMEADIVHLHGDAVCGALCWPQASTTVLSFYDPQKEALFSAADFLTRMENAALDAAQAPLHEQSAAQAAVAKAHAVVLPSEGARRQIRFSRRRLALKDALSAHPRCFGILGGVDENRFNGAMDPTLAQNYDASNLAGKQHCKRTLQESAGLAVRSDVLLAAAVLESNTAQNAESNEGLVKLAEAVLDLDIQLLFLDADDAQQRETIARLVRLQPSRIAVADPQTIGLTRLLAGVDIAIAAAEWAPWGRQALWPMALGTVPVVHDSGGLADLVVDWNFQTQTGGGFKFRPATAKNVIDAVKRAQEVFRHPETWQRLVVWNLQSVLGWKDARRRFWELYETLVNQKAQ